MYNTGNQYKTAPNNNKLVMLLAGIAIVAVAFAGYAFYQKKEADKLAALAQQKAIEVMQQQALALQQRQIADSSKEQAVMQREFAVESEVNALKQKGIAATASEKAKQKEEEAIEKDLIAQQKTLYAQQQKEIADRNANEAIKQQETAEQQKAIAEKEKLAALRLEALTTSKRLANESLVLMNARLYDSSKTKALKAYELNKANNGALQVNEIYQALQVNWVRSIDNKNQFTLHNYPVRCVSGVPGTNSFFSVDESGMVYKCVVKEGGIQKLASYNIREEARCIAVAADGNKAIVLTASGNAFVLNCAAAVITLQVTFPVKGVGKSVAFDGDDHVIILTSQNLYYASLNNINTLETSENEAVNALAIASNKIALATNSGIKVYSNWQSIVHQKAQQTITTDSKIASVAIDKTGRFVAAGSTKGVVYLYDLQSGESWSRSLHLSIVNDLKFALVANNVLQLASVGADQTGKCINVRAMLAKDNQEDVLTLKAHNKWIYAVDYLDEGRWLVTASEDGKVIASKPTASDLYTVLSKN